MNLKELSLLVCAALAGLAGQPLYGLGGLVDNFHSQALKALCDDSHDPFACTLWFIQDPPTNILSIGQEIHFDPSILTFDPADSGFLCNFSTGGECPVVAPATVSFLTSPLIVGGPLPGTTYSLTASANTVILSYDLSANPLPIGPDENYFAFAFKADIPLGANGSNVIFESTPSVGTEYQVLGPNHFCTLSNGLQCGSDSPVPGVSFVPEPNSIMFALLGSTTILGLKVAKAGKTARRRRQDA